MRDFQNRLLNGNHNANLKRRLLTSNSVEHHFIINSYISRDYGQYIY